MTSGANQSISCKRDATCNIFQQHKSQEFPILLASQELVTLCTVLSLLADEMCVCRHGLTACNTLS